MLTLESIAKQKLPTTVTARILIIDNDACPSAQNIVTQFRHGTDLEVEYRHVPGQNISTARNAGLDAARTPWIAFVDDDEFASARWLVELFAKRNGANAVFGPCEARYSPETPSWIRLGDYHSNRITETPPQITTGYTSNVLIDLNFVRRHGIRFEPELGRTGGEDTMFFNAMYHKGGVLKYAANAIVYEIVAPSRVNTKWIMRRRYRAGQVRALVSYKLNKAAYYRLSWAAPLKIIMCIIMSVVTSPFRTRAMWWLMRSIFHYGTLSYGLGARVHEEYAVVREVA